MLIENSIFNNALAFCNAVKEKNMEIEAIVVKGNDASESKINKMRHFAMLWPFLIIQKIHHFNIVKKNIFYNQLSQS